MIELKNSHPHILVVGDLMIDHYIWGECERISPEAPVQVVNVQKETSVLGGAGNVVNNLLTLGSQVSVASVIGADDVAQEMIEKLKQVGAQTSLLVEEIDRKTSKKSRVLASNQQVMRFDKESKNAITVQSEKILLENIEAQIDSFEVIVLSDYAKGVLTNNLCQKLIKLAKKFNIKVLVDPKGENYSKYSGAYLLTPNKKEASIATKVLIHNDETLLLAAQKLKEEINLDVSMITLSEDGIAIFDESLQKIPTVAKEVYDVTGAGDTVLASLAFMLGSQKELGEAARFANAAAAVVVGKIGSATVTIDEIIEYNASIHKASSEDFIKNFQEIGQIVKRAKTQNKKIVFTNGCFDILHLGHVKYLQKAKSFGDILILGLNSDTSVKRLKGESRPVNTEFDRAYILASLEAIDYVVIFEEDTPYELIKCVQPDILVKGGDYEGKEVIGTDIAKELKLVNFVDGKSTTQTIKKIQGSK